MFPTSDRAVDVVDTLVRYMKRGGVEMLMGQAAKLLLEQGHVQGIELQDGAWSLHAMCSLRVEERRTRHRLHRRRICLHGKQVILMVPLRPSLVPLVAKGRTVPR